jgi:hypothetical protein
MTQSYFHVIKQQIFELFKENKVSTPIQEIQTCTEEKKI